MFSFKSLCFFIGLMVILIFKLRYGFHLKQKVYVSARWEGVGWGSICANCLEETVLKIGICIAVLAATKRKIQNSSFHHCTFRG